MSKTTFRISVAVAAQWVKRDYTLDELQLAMLFKVNGIGGQIPMHYLAGV